MIYIATSKNKTKKNTQKMGVVERGYLFFYGTNKKVRQTNPFSSSNMYFCQ